MLHIYQSVMISKTSDLGTCSTCSRSALSVQLAGAAAVILSLLFYVEQTPAGPAKTSLMGMVSWLETCLLLVTEGSEARLCHRPL